MKAILCNTHGLPETLVLTSIPTPVPGEREVLIQVFACGVNFPDALIIQNKYQFKPPLPFSPGGEVAGIISAVGAKVKKIKPGDRVLALSGWGGFAESVIVDASRVFPMPPNMRFITAASTLYTFGTSYHALKDRGQLQAGETVLVLGAAGGVGIAAVELAKLMGATVIAAASSEEKLALCKKKGADHCINYSTEDLRTSIKAIVGDKGVDVVFDPIGGQLAEAALRSMAWKGRYLIVGFASGEIPQLPFNLALLKGCSVNGVFWGSFAEKEPVNSLTNFGTLLNWMNQGKISQPIHKIYSLEEAPTAIRDLMNRDVLGKAIVQIKEEELIESAVQHHTQPSKTAIAENIQTDSIVIKGLKDIKNHIGKTAGPSEWLVVTQKMIDDFAAATLDFQWVHIDTEKAKNLLPGGKTIAHGYLTMSLASHFFYELIKIENVQSFFNYGFNKARFISPVPVNSKIRLIAQLTNIEEQANGAVKLFLQCTIELEGSDKPAYVAELISLIV
ncbi:MAG: zinc-binding dehydrogenase [Sediminibacterium sp.]|nr:zinc-binding dehydrogenase [Sediminibacterium sp.]